MDLLLSNWAFVSLLVRGTVPTVFTQYLGKHFLLVSAKWHTQAKLIWQWDSVHIGHLTIETEKWLLIEQD